MNPCHEVQWNGSNEPSAQLTHIQFFFFFCSSMKMVTGRQKNDQVKFCGSGSISKRALFREITLRNLPHLDFEPDYVKSNRKTKRNIRGAVNDKSIWGSYKTVLQIPVLGQLEEVLVRAKLLLYEIYTNFFFFPSPHSAKYVRLKALNESSKRHQMFNGIPDDNGNYCEKIFQLPNDT